MVLPLPSPISKNSTLPNVRIQHGDALDVLARIPDRALSFVYLLHPDPWPKARHAKRRMVNDGPMQMIADKLKPGGEFRFGTDHPMYLRHALMVMRGFAADRMHRLNGWSKSRYRFRATAPADGPKPATNAKPALRTVKSGILDIGDGDGGMETGRWRTQRRIDKIP